MASLRPITPELCAGIVTERRQMQNEFAGLRRWQQDAMENWLGSDGPWLGCVTPGGGKTRLATRVMRLRKAVGRRRFSLVVSPTDSLKDQWAHSAKASDGIELATNIRSGDGFPSAYDGACVTYAQLPTIASTIEVWARYHGIDLLTVLDEIHHCAESAVWGEGATRVGGCSSRVMALSGTPFRSDGSPIPFVSYDDAGFVSPQYSYTYAQAIADGVCRRVQFRLRDADVRRKWSSDSSAEQCLWSSCVEDVGSWIASGLVHDGDAVRDILTDCVMELQKMLDAGDQLAACGIHCMSSGRNDIDDKYVNKIAKEVRRLTGSTPTVVHHGVPGASDEIRRFRDSRSPSDRFIVSIKQFGEGVDIPRCRVGGYLSNITSEMYLRQVVGRYVRHEDRLTHTQQYAVMVMPSVPVFSDFARRVEDEARVGLEMSEKASRLREQEQSEKSERPTVQTVSVTGQGGSIVMSGDAFSLDDESVRKAESISADFPAYPVGDLARIIRRSSSAPAACVVAEPPMAVRCKGLRKKCSAIAFSIAKNYPEMFGGVDYVQAEVNRRQNIPAGVKNAADWLEKNRGVDGLEQRLSLLRAMLEACS